MKICKYKVFEQHGKSSSDHFRAGIGTFDGVVFNFLAIFTVTGHGTHTSSAQEGGCGFAHIYLSYAHIVFAEQAQINFIYPYPHVYPDAEYVPRLNAAVLRPAAVLASWVDAPLLWGLASWSPAIVKSWACT